MAIAFKKSFDFTKGLVSFNKPRKNCNGVVVDRLGQLFVCKLGHEQVGPSWAMNKLGHE